MFYTEITETGQRGCITAYSKRNLATFAHGIHKHLCVSPLRDHDYPLRIYSALDASAVQARVILVDEGRDLIILEADRDVCKEEPALGSPGMGEGYYQLQLSAPDQEKSSVAVTRGRSATNILTEKRQYLVFTESNSDHSGGGCFAEMSNSLFGISAGCDTTYLRGTKNFNTSDPRYPSRAQIIPSIFFI